MPNDRLLYVGTYTRTLPGMQPAHGEGIYVLRFEPASGRLTPVGDPLRVENPSFLCLSPTGRRLYAVGELWEVPLGTVYSLSADPESGRLALLDSQVTGGWLPCYIALDRSAAWALVAHYMGGSASLLPLDTSGRIARPADVVQHEGSGAHPTRQEGPHAHCVVPDPANRIAFVTDLGLDRILSYALDLQAGRLVANHPPSVALPAGAGPRHLVFHPNGRCAYASNELDSTVAALAFDAGTGQLALRQIVSTLPDGWQGENAAADIHVHPSGRFLYVSNRGHDSIAVYRVDAAGGRLAPIAHEPTRGQTPRNFAIDPSGDYLLAANQDSDSIIVFNIDNQTGQLSPAGHSLAVPTPVCLKFGPAGG